MKNTETTERKSRVLNAVGEINDEFILEAAPTGRRVKKSNRALIAAAIGTAAAAALLLAVLGGKGKPSEAVQQVMESEKPVTTQAPMSQTPSPWQPAVTRTISLGKATNAKEWAELGANADVVDGLREHISSYIFVTFDDWSPPTPESILLSTDACIFHGVVREVENRRITIDSFDSMTNTDNSLDFDFCVVTFDVTECYNGSLASGEQTRVFFDTCICPLAEIEPPIGEKGSGQAYFTQLSPGTEVIAVVRECGINEEIMIYRGSENGDSEVLFSALYRDYAECRFKGGFGRLFLQTDDSFLYDVDVYDAAMFGENPSLDSAESYIRSLLAGFEL